MRKWADDATKTAVWEVYKFIHVNTVAPFKTFRNKIRKWKKIVLKITDSKVKNFINRLSKAIEKLSSFYLKKEAYPRGLLHQFFRKCPYTYLLCLLIYRKKDGFFSFA